jgi:hypothetical protein
LLWWFSCSSFFLGVFSLSSFLMAFIVILYLCLLIQATLRVFVPVPFSSVCMTSTLL